MSECIFCKIIERRIPAKIVHEDELSLAFDDVNPHAPVHTLIIPKKHVPTLLDLNDEENHLLGHLLTVAQKIARAKGIAERGFRILTNCNPEGGQIVYHLHFHLLGGRQLRSPFG